MRNLLACLISSILLVAIPATANCQSTREVITDIEARLKPHFPRSAIAPFECISDSEKTMCQNNINFGEFGINYLIKIGSDARLQTMVAIMASPAVVTEQGSTRANMVLAFGACAIAILSITVPDLPAGKRLDFMNKVMESGDDGVKRGGWEFTGGSALFTTFSAARLR